MRHSQRFPGGHRGSGAADPDLKEIILTERLYEGLFLVDAAVAATDWAEIEKQICGLIEEQGATIEYSERWPEQRLAYPVKGVKRGVYFLAYFTSDTGAIAAIRSDGQLNENVLRMLIIQEDFLGVEMAKRKEAAARAAAVPAPESKPAPDAGVETEGAVDDAMAASEGDPLDGATSDADAVTDGIVVGEVADASEPEVSEPEVADASEPEVAEPEVVDASEPEVAEVEVVDASEPEVSEPEVVSEVATADGDDEAAVGESVEEVANTEEETN